MGDKFQGSQKRLKSVQCEKDRAQIQAKVTKLMNTEDHKYSANYTNVG